VHGEFGGNDVLGVLHDGKDGNYNHFFERVFGEVGEVQWSDHIKESGVKNVEVLGKYVNRDGL
jgi:hypothetical protein